MRVSFTVGPVASDLVLEWLAHSRRMVTAVRRQRHQLSIKVRDEMLDLIEAVFDIWEAHARRGDVFMWSTETDTDQVEHIVDQWLAIGSLTADDLGTIGMTWAPERTRPVADAVVAGATAALRQSDGRGPDLAARLER